MSDYIVIKRDASGDEVLRYSGQLLYRRDNEVCVQAPFSLDTRDLGYVTLEKGDLFTEWFYSERWYNIFRVESRRDGTLKGFYCNFTRPAEITDESVASDDLALDFFVSPDGSVLVLDEEDYQALSLSPSEHQAVEAARNELLEMIEGRVAPFDY